MFLDRMMQEMAKHLRYYWLCAVGQKSVVQSSRIVTRKVLSTFKPLLVFAKPPVCAPPSRQFFEDLILGTKSKEHHKWGQGVEQFQYCVERLTEPGQLVVDPFVGGGTTPIACLATGRRYIGTEVDPGSPPLVVSDCHFSEGETEGLIESWGRSVPRCEGGRHVDQPSPQAHQRSHRTSRSGRPASLQIARCLAEVIEIRHLPLRSFFYRRWASPHTPQKAASFGTAEPHFVQKCVDDDGMGAGACVCRRAANSFSTGHSPNARKKYTPILTNGTSSASDKTPGYPILEQIFHKGHTTQPPTIAITRSSGSPMLLSIVALLSSTENITRILGTEYSGDG